MSGGSRPTTSEGIHVLTAGGPLLDFREASRGYGCLALGEAWSVTDSGWGTFSCGRQKETDCLSCGKGIDGGMVRLGGKKR
jgi:hypothetical protein